MFCKLYVTLKGQILVKLDVNEDGAPEVRYYVQPEDLGVCSFAHVFEDTDEGWDRAEASFAQASLAQAITIAENIHTVALSSTTEAE